MDSLEHCMLNPIRLIKKMYQCDNAEPDRFSQLSLEQHEAELGIQLPALLYHYLLELGNAKAINESHHQFIHLPFERLGDYILIGKTCDDDGVWGIHQNDLKEHNPLVQMSRNFDALEQAEVHWFDTLPLAEFLLAQAINNGVNGGLAYHAQIYDFAGDTIPPDLGEKLANLAPAIQEISDLNRPHEKYFATDDFGAVMVINLDDGKPTAFLMGSQNPDLFDAWLDKLAL